MAAWRPRALAFLTTLALASSGQARAGADEVGSPARQHAMVVVAPFAALGLDPEQARRLESLFRVEVERLIGRPVPSVAAVASKLQSERKLEGCTAAAACLADLGASLGGAQVVGGTLGELGTSYVIDLKLVDVATRAEVRRVSTPLEGSPDDLIEAVRVAAHQLLAPETVRGSLSVLTDLPGATVRVDGTVVGTTPLARELSGLAVGKHEVVVERAGGRPVTREIDVRFQKTSQLVVGMLELAPTRAAAPRARDERTPTWRWVALGAAGVAVGVAIGLALRGSGDTIVRCGERPEACP